ncbi:MAG: arginine--tRNA ligase [Saprospiraceae bacterium]|nr:arginine--tRNA ligase [Saprospiraceae bacterium]MDW8484197.1 arginine--tRNA ligase [Saprospiraceae bacterium]
MNIVKILQQDVAAAVERLYGQAISAEKVQINATLPEFTGDYTAVLFPFVKIAKKSPEVIGAEVGTWLQRETAYVKNYNVIKGFLNLELKETFWHEQLQEVLSTPHYGRFPSRGERIVIEYSSPNTNKPLHLGHIRNCLLGWSCSQILEAVGYEVIKVQIINDRGVAICKSMLAWQKFGEGRTPQSEGMKGDHFVGDYYVLFERKLQEEYEAWQQTPQAKALYETHHKPGQREEEFFKDYKNRWFNEHSRLGAEVREMLLRWEAGDPQTLALWRQMNSWVYEGFEATYAQLGVQFDKNYYESDTYLLGKDIIEEGLQKGVFFRKADGSVWIDLTDVGYDQKVVLRSDGTSVYITQDLGTARMRYRDFGCKRMVYVVADEQNYHFAVLFEILRRLGEPYADGLYHLSYGLVELPTGRMKTREGTVVDADDLIAEVMRLAREQAAERGSPTEGPEAEENLRRVAMGALKFFMIRVNPKRRMVFNPEESVDLQGQTGPYIQYSWVRIHGLMQRVQQEGVDLSNARCYTDFQSSEKELLRALCEYPSVVLTAAQEYDPSHVANYSYQLAKTYHRFWHDLPIFSAPTPEARAFRLQLSCAVAQVLESAMRLLGIEMPTRM